MDTTNFKTKGYARYQTSHESLNKFVRFAVIAVDNLQNESQTESDLTNKMAKLMVAAGEKWPATSYAEPFAELKQTRLKITQSGIMWVYSAFDVFLSHIEGLCANNQEPDDSVTTAETTDSVKIFDLYKKYGWNKKELDYLLPLFSFYTLARHCIVHNMGKATKQLNNVLNSEEFKNAIVTWPTVIPKRKLSAPPHISDDNTILLNPHHAITYSDICFRIAMLTNENVIDTVGLGPFLVPVAKARLLELTKPEGPLTADMYSYLKMYLFKEYFIKKPDNDKMREILTKEGLLEKCKNKYRTFKDAANQLKKVSKSRSKK